MSQQYNFQYCQKLVLFDKEERVLLARRKDEVDYNDTYSFIGGKLETTDGGLIEGIRREKRQEIGRKALILVAPQLSYDVYYTKRDGSAMVLPHIYSRYIGGEIELGNEYSDFKWIEADRIDAFEPKIDTVSDAVRWARVISKLITKHHLIEIQ